MKQLSLWTAAATALLASTAFAQDVAVSKVAGNGFSDYAYYGQSGGVAAYSMASTSCNVGNVVIEWNDSIGKAPVIAQNMFRIHDGRIVQLGYSWLKDSFCAVSEPSCGSCQATPCDTLGIGCADTYGSGLNDGAGGVAKFRVNPTTGEWPASWGAGPSGPLPLRGRLQMPVSELADPNSVYVSEIQYISEHDQMAGNGLNNSSWHECRWTSSSLNSLTNTGGIHMFEPAIYAWQVEHPDVDIQIVENTDEGGTGVHGWFFVASRAHQLPSGKYRYDYAVLNFNSDDSAGSFSLPASCSPTNLFFRDVDHHSGSPWGNDDWTVNLGANDITWSTETFAQNNNANAIRWGTMYSFGFEADAQPTTGQATLGLFKSGGSLSVDVKIPDTNCCSGGSFTTFCSANTNSGSILGANLAISGSTNVADNDIQLSATALPFNQFAYFFMSQGTDFVPMFGGSQGNLCVSQPLYRFSNNILNTGGSGTANFSPDMNNLPQGVVFQPGDTWHFQLWFRDQNPQNTSNTTPGATVTFCQ